MPRIVDASGRAGEHERIRFATLDERLQSACQVAREGKVAACVPGLSGTDHTPEAFLPTCPLSDLHMWRVAIQRKVLDGERDRLSGAGHSHHCG